MYWLCKGEVKARGGGGGGVSGYSGRGFCGSMIFLACLLVL